MKLLGQVGCSRQLKRGQVNAKECGVWKSPKQVNGVNPDSAAGVEDAERTVPRGPNKIKRSSEPQLISGVSWNPIPIQTGEPPLFPSKTVVPLQHLG
jgi:hypothetical protein